MDDNFEDLESEINLYLYKNKLVGIEWETERYSIEMNLGGEDTILDEIEIVCQEYGQEFADIKVDGKNRDGKEVYEIQKNDMEYANITYDYEDEGKLEIQCIKRGIYLEADLEIKYNKITADVSSFVMDNDELFKGTVYIQKGGKVDKLELEQSFIDCRMADYIKENRWKREYYYFLKAINDKDTDKIRKKYPQLAEAAEDFIEYNYYTLYDFWGGNDNLSPTDELWFSLIYLDDDEIPELYIEGDYEGLLVRSDGKTLQGVKWGDDIASYGGYRMDTYSIYFYNEREGMIISETDGPQLEFVVFQYEDGICKVVNHMSSPTYEEQEEYKNQTDILLDGIDELTEDNMFVIVLGYMFLNKHK